MKPLNLYHLPNWGLLRVPVLWFAFLTLNGCLDDFDLDTAAQDFDSWYYGSAAIANEPSAVAPVQNFCQPVEYGSTIDRTQLNELIHIAPGNSGLAMHRRFGLPHCWSGDTEYYLFTPDPTLMIGVRYDHNGSYIDYTFSAENY